jgi:hypothetical protein
MSNWNWLSASTNTNNWLFTAIPAAATVGFASFYVIYFMLPNRFPNLQRVKSLGARATVAASALSMITAMVCKLV